MHLQGILGDVVATGPQLAQLTFLGRGNGDPGTDALGIGSVGVEFDAEVTVGRLGVVAVVDQMVGTVVHDHDVDVAVAVGVEAGDAAALALGDETDLLGPFVENAVAPGVVEANLVVGEVLVELPVPAVDMEDVQMAVVVEVGEATAPAPAAVLDLRRVVTSVKTPEPSLR